MTSPLRYGALPVALCLGLSACEEGGLLERGAAEPDGGTPMAATSVTRDVEMPDVFSTQEMALWDGRPSLGGVWVAHPDVTDPERVKIANTVTGQSIEGALFRREREAPGPRIQVSSEAASELGILAGQPTELALVAIREETVEVEVPAAAALDIPAGDDAPVGAIDAAVIADADTLDDNAAVENLGPVTVAAAEPPRKGFWGRLRDSFRRSPEPAVAASTIAAGADLGTDMAAPAPDVETAPLDPVASVAAAAIDEAEAGDASSPGNAYIQVGLFGQESNARAAADTLRQNGIVPNVALAEVGGTSYWRVRVGPLATVSDREQVIETLRGLGFQDAYFTSS